MKVDKKFFEPLIEKARELIDPEKIILFGSFARGDNSPKSDFDLAFDFKENAKWSIFTFWVEEDFKTLRKVDLVNMNSASKDIIESIQEEGVILYEK